MAGDNYHFGACRPYLLHFLFTVKDSFRVVPGCKRTASASAAQLVLFCRVKIDPVLNTLVKYPPRFVKKSVTEYLFGNLHQGYETQNGCCAKAPVKLTILHRLNINGRLNHDRYLKTMNEVSFFMTIFIYFKDFFIF